ncbi:DUF6192 family protein [Streptomyces sp. NPDC127051]|uniref:DUF6192 family protein n=1 Tax=Streptomyces sp. NPDC127051 TaxID=3347119 RepID=UPI003669DE14
MRSARWTASKWPEQHRRASALRGLSVVHRILASIEDEGERFAAILNPPEGKERWTTDAANRRAGRQVQRVRTVEDPIRGGQVGAHLAGGVR